MGAGRRHGRDCATGDRILVEWEGQRSTWERDARPQLVAAITADHDGLYCLINGLGDLFQAVFAAPLYADADAAEA